MGSRRPSPLSGSTAPTEWVVSSLDRLARSLTLQEASLQQVWGSGGSVFAVDTGEVMADDPDDPVRTFTVTGAYD